MTQPKRTVLVTGFGPFPGVQDNVSGRVALALDQVETADVKIVGRVVNTSFSKGPERVLALAREFAAHAVVALGVAVKRTEVCVETQAVYVERSKADVDGICETGLPCSEPTLCTRPMQAFADALSARISTDAGRYVCNATLYRMLHERPDIPVVFVHLPPDFRDEQRLAAALNLLVC